MSDFRHASCDVIMGMTDLVGGKPSDRLNNAQEKRERRFPLLKISDWAGMALIIPLATISYFQFTNSRQQAPLVAVQIHQMKVDKRPWISDLVTAPGSIKFIDWMKQKSILLGFRQELNNYGRSPADNVQVALTVVKSPGIERMEKLKTVQEDICNRARATARMTILPGKSDCAATAIEAAYPTEASEAVLFEVVGCAVYDFAETEHGETGFRFKLGRMNGGKIDGLSFIEGPPQPYKAPIRPELLATANSTPPPNVGVLEYKDVIFIPDEKGNYAK